MLRCLKRNLLKCCKKHFWSYLCYRLFTTKADAKLHNVAAIFYQSNYTRNTPYVGVNSLPSLTQEIL